MPFKLKTELRKRKIGRAIVVYLGSAWILIEALSYFTKRFDWTESIEDVVFVILIFGIPATILYAWFHGEEGRQKVTLTEIGLHVMNIVAAFFFIFQVLTSFENDIRNVRNNLTLDNIDRSIAVLPFINLSNDPDQEYFSDGMMEEILNHLVKLKNLKVTSRTSSMQYKKTAKSLGEIGNELGVKYVLEGSVRKYEDNLRINTKLIDVETDINLWSQSYDSKLTDIFDIQSEIAKSVTSELSMILSPDEIEQIEKKGTKNLKAYNFYLKGRHFFHNRTEKDEELKKSIEYFEKALAIDQQYALVHAGLADANLMLAWRASRRDTLQSAEKSSKAKSHAKKALEIDPNLAEAHAVIGIMTCFFDWQWQEGGKILERAIQFSPNYSTGHQYYSEYLSVLRKTEAARIQINKALDLNPLSSMLYIISSSYYFNEGKLDKSLQEVLRAKDLDSNLPSVYWKLFHIYKEQGLEEKAVEQLKHFFNLDRSLVEHIKFIDDVYTKQGMNGLVKWWMDFEENKKPNNPHYIAMNYAAIGENALALEWLEKSFELGGPDLPSMNNNRMFANFCSDPRFITMLESMGLASEKN